MLNFMRNRRLDVVLALTLPACLSTMLAACASGSGGARSSPSPEQRLASIDIDDAAYAKLGYRRDWSGFPNVAAGGYIKLIEVTSELVFVQDSHSTVSALDVSNGSAVWATQLGGPLTRFVGLNRVNEGLLASSDAEAFLINQKNGSYISRHGFEKVVNTRPVVVGDLAFYGTSVGELLCHRISTGLKYRGVAMPGSIDQPPVLIGNTVGAVTQAGDVLFVAADSGTLISRTKIFGGMATRPISDGGMMYIASLDQSVYAFTPSATLAWRYKTSSPLRAQPAVHNGTIYVAIPGEGMTALDAATGAVKWKTPALGGEVIGVRKGDLMVWDGEFMYRVDAAHGEIVSKFKMPAVRSYALEKFEDGTLYAVSHSGVVTRFVTR